MFDSNLVLNVIYFLYGGSTVFFLHSHILLILCDQYKWLHMVVEWNWKWLHMECIPTGIWWEFFSCRWMVQRRTESTILGHWCLLEWTWMRSLESMSDRSNKRYEEPVLTRERGSTTVRGTSQRHCCIQLGISGLIAEWFGWVWCGSQFEQPSNA